MLAADESLASHGFVVIEVVWTSRRSIGGIQSSFAVEEVKIVG